MAKDIDVSIVRPHFVPGILWPVPLVEHFLYTVLMAINAEQCRPLLGFVGGVGLDMQFHPNIVSGLDGRNQGEKTEGGPLPSPDFLKL